VSYSSPFYIQLFLSFFSCLALLPPHSPTPMVMKVSIWSVACFLSSVVSLVSWPTQVLCRPTYSWSLCLFAAPLSLLSYFNFSAGVDSDPSLLSEIASLAPFLNPSPYLLLSRKHLFSPIIYSICPLGFPLFLVLSIANAHTRLLSFFHLQTFMVNGVMLSPVFSPFYLSFLHIFLLFLVVVLPVEICPISSVQSIALCLSVLRSLPLFLMPHICGFFL
jgi:hypothetical protein